MKTNKPYTNATFTKRVDKDTGRHHTERPPAEPTKCSRCGAVYAKRRWLSPEKPEQNELNKPWHPAETVICPACKKQQEGLPAGFVYLDGTFLSAHRDEIQGLLHNVAERAAVHNPLARVIDYEGGEGGQLIVTTTTEELAQRLGRELKKTFKGEIQYDFSHENKLARVYWHRD